MTSRILATASVIAIAIGTAATAQELPGWEPRTICTEDSTPQYCGFLEGQARTQISQQWQFIPSRVRERCLSKNAEMESESWRVFGDCLADAARGPDAGGSAATENDESGSNDDDGQLQAELDAATARIVELEAAASDGSDSDARVAELEAELAKSQTTARSSEVRIEGLQQRLLAAVDAQGAATEDGDERIAELEAELAKSQTMARSSEVRIEGLQQRLLAAVDAQGDGDTGDADALQAALDKAEARARGAEFRSKALQATLVETLASAKAAESAGTASGDRIAALEADLEKAQTDVKRGAARIEGLQGRLMEVQASASTDTDEAADERVAALEAQIARIQDEADTQSTQNRARIADLEERLVKASKEASGEPDEETAMKLATLEADLAKAQASTRSGEVRIEGLQQRLMDAMAREDAQAGDPDETADLTERLAIATSRIDVLKSRLTTRREALKVAERERGAFETNLGTARNRIAALQDTMIESRRAAADEAATGSDAEAKAVEDGRRLQRLLDNQRDRASRVGAKVAEQRGRIRELEGEVRSLRRVAVRAGSVSCQQRMSDAVSGGGIQFANNKADIRADAARTIDGLIAIAKDCGDSRITVKGHTDTSGDRGYNLQLSQRRADAVVTYMESKGIAGSRIEAVGVGPDEPIADNNTRAGRRQNRRIEIVIE